MIVLIISLGFFLGFIAPSSLAPPPDAPMTPALPSHARAGGVGRRPRRARGLLRALIRIPSINPPDPPGPELDAALPAAVLVRGPGPRGIASAPGRGHRHRPAPRRRHRWRAAAPALAPRRRPGPPEDGWTHDPFAAEIADGYLYGRGAVDMKQIVAMELEVMRLLARRARAAGRDPARDPIPGLRRDVLFASTADEEAGGLAGAGWLADHRPRPCAPRRDQRGRRRLGRRGRAPALSDPGRREGLRRLPAPRPRHVGPRLHAPRGQRRGPRRGGRPPHGRPRRAAADRCHAPLPRRGPGRDPDGAGRARRRDRGRRPAPRRCRHPCPVRPDATPGRSRAPPRHDQPGRPPRRHQVQRDPGRGRRRDRLPPLPGTTAEDMREAVLARLGPTWRRTARSSSSSAARRSPRPRRGRAVRRSSRRRSAPTTPTASRSRPWRRSRPTRSHLLDPGRPDLRLLAAPPSPTSGSSSGSTASTSGSASRPSAGACPSSTMRWPALRMSRQGSWCGPAPASRHERHAPRRRCVQRNRRPRPHSRSESCADDGRGSASISAQDPSS